MWFGGITTEALTATMCKWLSGGALRDQVPDSLRAHMFDGPAVRLGELDQDIECDASGDGSKAKGTPVFLR